MERVLGYMSSNDLLKMNLKLAISNRTSKELETRNTSNALSLNISYENPGVPRRVGAGSAPRSGRGGRRFESCRPDSASRSCLSEGRAVNFLRTFFIESLYSLCRASPTCLTVSWYVERILKCAYEKFNAGYCCVVWIHFQPKIFEFPRSE